MRSAYDTLAHLLEVGLISMYNARIVQLQKLYSSTSAAPSRPLETLVQVITACARLAIDARCSRVYYLEHSLHVADEDSPVCHHHAAVNVMAVFAAELLAQIELERKCLYPMNQEQGVGRGVSSARKGVCVKVW